MLIKTAERIKELREKNNMTQTDLAKRLGVTRSSVNAWEMGISIPTTEKIVDLCLVLHSTSDYILGLEKKEMIVIDKYSSREKELVYCFSKIF